MYDNNKLVAWIENGKQVGKIFSFSRNGKKYWSSVAIQKHGGVYKVFVDEIEEEKMAGEYYERDEINIFTTIDEAIYFVEKTTSLKIVDMRPCKGQKIFNPGLLKFPVK